MPLANFKQFYGRGIDLGLDSIVVIEPFKVTGLAGNVNAASDPPLPQRGMLHPDQVRYPGAVVDRVRLVQWMNKDAAIVNVIYRRQLTGYAGGPRRAARSSSYREPIAIPVWRRIVFNGVHVGWEEDRSVIFPRMVFMRVETRFVGGNAVTAIQNALIQNAGLYYTIDGFIYRLSDQSAAYYDGLSYTRAEYVFEYHVPILGIPLNDPEYGNEVSIPFLPAHYKWVSRRHPTDSLGSPIVSVKTPPNIGGGALPGFP